MAITLKNFIIEQDTSNVTENYITTANTRSLSLGPITINTGFSVNVSNNSIWIVL